MAHLETLSREYRIDFPGWLGSSNWPECHRTTLENARKIRDKKHDTYATASGVAESEPCYMMSSDLLAGFLGMA